MFSESRINMKNLKLLIELNLHAFVVFCHKRAFQNLNFIVLQLINAVSSNFFVCVPLFDIHLNFRPS